MVRVELEIGGRLADRVDLDVHSSRFAGVVRVPEHISGGNAAIRVMSSEGRWSQRAITHFSVETG
jgi:hypothetical protein